MNMSFMEQGHQESSRLYGALLFVTWEKDFKKKQFTEEKSWDFSLQNKTWESTFNRLHVGLVLVLCLCWNVACIKPGDSQARNIFAGRFGLLSESLSRTNRSCLTYCLVYERKKTYKYECSDSERVVSCQFSHIVTWGVNWFKLHG